MHYDDGAFYRPLFENDMVPLQVAKGCSYNACKFCDMYHQQYTLSEREEILEDIKEIWNSGYMINRIFLTGGNAFSIPHDLAVWVLERIREYSQTPFTVGCFARITDIAKKTDDEIRQLMELGVDDISIGTESGLDEALGNMNKGFTSKDIIEQCSRLDRIGMNYNLFYLIGMAGKGKCLEAAKRTAEVYDRTNPRRIMIHTMTPFRGTKLWEEIESGSFEPAGEKEILSELREFISRSNLHTYILGNHYGNMVRPNGWIPENKELFVKKLDEAIENLDEEMLRNYRKQMKSI